MSDLVMTAAVLWLAGGTGRRPQQHPVTETGEREKKGGKISAAVGWDSLMPFEDADMPLAAMSGCCGVQPPWLGCQWRSPPSAACLSSGLLPAEFEQSHSRRQQTAVSWSSLSGSAER